MAAVEEQKRVNRRLLRFRATPLLSFTYNANYFLLRSRNLSPFLDVGNR